MQRKQIHSSPLSRPWVPEAWIKGLLLAAVLVTYSPATMAGFIWDDDDYVTENRELESPAGLWRIWFEPGATPQYYPLVFSTFWFEYQLWGLNPAGYHVVNVLLHAVNALLLYRGLTILGVPGAAFAAAIFVVTPVHVESVAWISERKNVLSGAFYLSSFLMYWRFVSLEGDPLAASRTRWAWYALSLLLFACALMSKSVTCSLPAAILLVLWWKEGRLSFRQVLPLLPMFAIGVAAGINTIVMERDHVGAQGMEWDWTWLERVLIAGRVLWFYAWKLVWPQPLVFIYPKWQIDASAWWQYLFVLGYFGVLVGLWLARRRWGRGPLVAVLFFSGTLFPALGFIDVYPMRYSFVADHFQYLASIGMIVLLAGCGATLTVRFGWHPWAKLAVMAVVLLFFMRVSFVRCFDYLNAETLWTATLRDNPEGWMAKYNLASLRFQQQRYEEAYRLMQDSLRPRENDEPSREERADMYFFMGATLLSLGEPARADEYYRKALDDYQMLAESEDPPNPATQNNLGIVYGVLQQPRKAIDAFEKALEIDPDQPKVQLNLGEAHYRLGEFEQSKEYFRQVLESDPEHTRARYNLGTSLWSLGQREAAIDQMQRTLEIDPNYDPARQFLFLARAAESDDGIDRRPGGE